MEDNNWGEMKAAAWRGAVGAKLDIIGETLKEVCTMVRRHDTELVVLNNDRKRQQAAGVARWKFWAAIIAALLTGPLTALVLRG